MDNMDTTAPSPPLPLAAALVRQKVYADELNGEATLLERRKVCLLGLSILVPAGGVV